MRTPNRFVGLHNHTGFSPFDGLGYPDEHFKWCLENGLDGHAITEHGNANSFAHAMLWAEKWNKENKDKPFKYIPGVESYFHPDLDEWKRAKLIDEDAKAEHKEAQKLLKKLKETVLTQINVTADADDETIDMTNQLTIENEDESKSNKYNNPVNRRHHLVLLPKNQAGLLKIFSLISQGYLHGFYRFPRIDAKMLKEAAKDGNIIASSACIAGFPAWTIFKELQKVSFDDLNQKLLEDPALLEKCVTNIGNVYEMMTDALGKKNYFLELQFNRLPAQNLVNRAILEFARRAGKEVQEQLIVTCDAHYPKPELWKERELYKKLGFMNYAAYSPDSLPKSRDDLKAELYPKNASQIWEEYLIQKEGTSFYDDDLVADAIERTHYVAHNVIGEITPDRSAKFPNEKLIPKNSTSFKYLVKLCQDGLIKRKLDDRPEYVERLKEELNVIKTMKNSDYFVSYQKIMELARGVCLVGPGRGSGGGSLVAYVLYITDLDPLKWDLPFARFLSVYRKGAPDIDTDLANRDKVLEQLRNFFGFENVVPISNYNTFKLKTLVKDIGKFYGVSFEETNNATRTVEHEVRKATMKHGDDKNLFVLKYEDAIVHSPSFKAFIDAHPEVAESIQILFKQNRSLGRHAGGVLIADDLPNKMPLVVSGGEPQSPWVEGVNFKHLEYIGNFIKYDLLGLETLRLIERSIELILMKQGIKKPTFAQVKEWYEQNMSPDVINFDDAKVYEYVYHGARWAGIFQLTSSGAQRLFKKAKPNAIIDIATLTSIYRPGPLAANVDKLYIGARNGDVYPWGDNRINDILVKTNGLIIFQEQVMELAEKCAGFPKEQCDEVRRAIMKRSISGGEAAKKAAQETRDSFVKGCVVNGYTESVANNLYDKILFFAGYGFNKAHAVAYAIDSYWCAWLMTYYEEEWIIAYLESMSGNDDKRAKAFGEVRQLGYQIVPIDINYATHSWRALPGKKLMPSLMSVSGIGESAIEEIVANRPYKTIEEMLWNDDGTWRHGKFNRKALEALIKIGAFQSMDIIGNDKMFVSYRHMFETMMGDHKEMVTRKRKGVEETVEVIKEHANLIKRSTKSDPHEGRKLFFELAREYRDKSPEWTPAEKVAIQTEYFGTFDATQLIPVDTLARLEEKGVKAIDYYEASDIYWFVVMDCVMKKTKNGKTYALIQAMGPAGKPHKINVWGAKEPYQKLTLYLGEIDANDYGKSTTSWKMKLVPEKKAS